LSRAKALKTLDSKRVLAHCEQVGVEVRIKTRRLAAEEVRSVAHTHTHAHAWLTQR
jgi:hypothetical protein